MLLRKAPPLQVEQLEERRIPAVFHPVASAPDNPNDPTSLRYAIVQADSNADASNTIQLHSGPVPDDPVPPPAEADCSAWSFGRRD